MSESSLPARREADGAVATTEGALVARPEDAGAYAEEALYAAKPAVGTGATPLVAQLIALALICLGVVGVQGALVRWGWVTGPSWTTNALAAADGLRHDVVWVLVGGVVAVLLALLLLRVALRRRPRRGVAVAAYTGVDLRTDDVERLAAELLSGPGVVLDPDVRAARRKVTVRVSSGATPDMDAEVADDVRQRLEPLLTALDRRPRLRVKVRKQKV